MFYDLNVPYREDDPDLARKLHFLVELGYNVVVLNHNITGKLDDQPCAIPNPLPIKDIPPKLEIRRRVTLKLTESLQNARLAALAQQYDVLALRPVDEKTLQLACSSYDCDIISLDMSNRFGFPFRFKTFAEAIKAGKRIEICYGPGITGDASARKQLISNATQLIRATRSRGIVISSEAKAVQALRGPWDVINLAAIWGLGQERGHEAVAKEARGILTRAELKRTGYRGVVNVIHGGEKPAAKPDLSKKRKGDEQSKPRKEKKAKTAQSVKA